LVLFGAVWRYLVLKKLFENPFRMFKAPRNSAKNFFVIENATASIDAYLSR